MAKTYNGADNTVARQPACDFGSCPANLPFLCWTGARPLPGACCPVCPIDNPCLYSRCIDDLFCEDGQTPVRPEGQCCAKCPPAKCDPRQICELPLCPYGYEPIVPEGECCPKCTDCSKVFCEKIICEDGSIPRYDPRFGCCPVCPPQDCSRALCPDIECPEGMFGFERKY